MFPRFLLFPLMLLLQLMSLFSAAQRDTLQHKKLPDTAEFKVYQFNWQTTDTNISNLMLPTDYTLPFFNHSYIAINKLSIFNGNTGSPLKPFHYDEPLSDNYFTLLPFHAHLLFSSEKIPFIVSDNPASMAYYSSGKSKEQHFHFLHTQRIDSVFSFFIHYNIINAPGLYKNQRTNQSHFYGYLMYRSKNQRYIAAAGASLNKILQKENGGISIPEQFEDSTFYDRQFTLVDFITAERKYKDSEFFIQGVWKLFKDETKLPLYFVHKNSFLICKNVFTDSDPLNSPYPQVLFDSVATYDSTYVSLLNNQVFLTNRHPNEVKNQSNLLFRAGYGLQNAVINQRTYLKHFTKHSFFASAQLKFLSSFYLNGNVDFFLGNVNNSNLRVLINFSKHFSNGFFRSAGIGSQYKKLQPQFVYEHYYSNHYVWDTSFVDQQFFKLSFFTNTALGCFNIAFNSLDNYVFLNEYALPQQYQKPIFWANASLRSKITVGKMFFETETGTNILPEDSPIRLPEFYTELKAGVGFPMFKKSLNVFVGVESIYFSSFYADKWSLATGLFYLQNSKKIGNYLYPGVFVGVNIKRARIFIMMDNVTSGLMEYDYYAMPGYPRYDRFIRWGLSWSFFN